MMRQRILIALMCFSLAACAASYETNESTGQGIFELAADDDGCTGKPWKCGSVADVPNAKPIDCDTCHGATGNDSIRAAEQRNNIFDEGDDFEKNAFPTTPRCPVEQQPRYPAGCYPCDGSICCPAAVADRLMQSTADNVADVAYDVRKALFGQGPSDLQCSGTSNCCKACSYVYGGWYCYPHAC